MSRPLTLSLALMTALGTACAAQQPGGAAAQGPASRAERWTPAATGGAPAPAAGGTFEWHTYTGAEGTRRYRLFVPASYDRGRPAPLVVMLHGCTQDPDDFARGTRFNQIADSAGVLVAYPEQTAAENPQKCWSWYDPAHQRAGSGQPAQIAGITREVMAAYAVDPARVYVAGISAGGAMALNVAVSYPTLYAAVGVHSGIDYGAASDVPGALRAMKEAGAGSDAAAALATDALKRRGAPFPLIAVQGGADPVVAPANLEMVVYHWQVLHENVFGLARPQPGTTVEPARATAGGLEVFAIQDPRIPLLGLRVDGLGHAWSGGSPEGTYTDARGPDASREMLRFFLSNPMR